MFGKKQADKEPTEQELLEQRVDAMMDPSPPAKAGVEIKATPVQDSTSVAGPPPLNIFEGTAAPISQDSSQEATTEPVDSGMDAQPFSDPQTDAAIDDIVAHEPKDTAKDKGQPEEQATPKSVAGPAPKKLHHHPIFWTLVAVVAVFALLAAFLLTTGSDAQGWWQTLQAKV